MAIGLMLVSLAACGDDASTSATPAAGGAPRELAMPDRSAGTDLNAWMRDTLHALAEVREANATAERTGNALAAQAAHDRLFALRSGVVAGTTLRPTVMQIQQIGRISSAGWRMANGASDDDTDRAIVGDVLHLPRNSAIEVSLVVPKNVRAASGDDVPLERLSRGQFLRFTGTVLVGAEYEAMVESWMNVIAPAESLSTRLVIRAADVELLDVSQPQFAERATGVFRLGRATSDAAELALVVATQLQASIEGSPWRGATAPYDRARLEARMAALAGPVRLVATLYRGSPEAPGEPAALVPWIRGLLTRDRPDILAPSAHPDPIRKVEGDVARVAAELQADLEVLTRWSLAGGDPGEFARLGRLVDSVAGAYELEVAADGNFASTLHPTWYVGERRPTRILTEDWGRPDPVIPGMERYAPPKLEARDERRFMPAVWKTDEVLLGRSSPPGALGTLVLREDRSYVLALDVDTRRVVETLSDSKWAKGDVWRREIGGRWSIVHRGGKSLVIVTPAFVAKAKELEPQFPESRSGFDHFAAEPLEFGLVASEGDPRQVAALDSTSRSGVRFARTTPLRDGAKPLWAKTSPAQDAYAKDLGLPVWREVSLDRGRPLRFVLVPPGGFMMGSFAAEAGRDAHESVHEVKLTQPLYVSITEVSNGQFRRFKPDHDSGTSKGVALNDDAQPVTDVTYDEAVAFAAWISAKGAAPGCRLPTEAEWEYACRAGTTTSRWWGNEPEHALGRASVLDPASKRQFEIAWDGFAFDDGFRASAPVGSLAPNPWGLHDMLGNVWEWCADWYGAYRAERREDPVGPGEAEAQIVDASTVVNGKVTTTPTKVRVVRGGSFVSDPAEVRSAARRWRAPSHRGTHTGFRVVLPVPRR